MLNHLPLSGRENTGGGGVFSEGNTISFVSTYYRLCSTAALRKEYVGKSANVVILYSYRHRERQPDLSSGFFSSSSSPRPRLFLQRWITHIEYPLKKKYQANVCSSPSSLACRRSIYICMSMYFFSNEPLVLY